jgi:hypothetical protein
VIIPGAQRRSRSAPHHRVAIDSIFNHLHRPNALGQLRAILLYHTSRVRAGTSRPPSAHGTRTHTLPFVNLPFFRLTIR